jgi:hypothetical protein
MVFLYAIQRGTRDIHTIHNDSSSRFRQSQLADYFAICMLAIANNLSDVFSGFGCYKRSYIRGTYRAVLDEMVLVVGFEKPATSGASSHI